MKRFTERDEFGNADIIGVDSMNLQGNLGWEELRISTKALNRLAELEDKLESGQLVELPCNVGDDVWVVDYDGDVVSYVCVGGNSNFLFLSPTVYAGKDITTPEELCNYYVDYYMEDGDDADIVIFPRNKCFKTKSQAERRLAKQKGE